MPLHACHPENKSEAKLLGVMISSERCIGFLKSDELYSCGFHCSEREEN